jgi:hypothetical protein
LPLALETGYYYLRSRYYEPMTAQFLSRDPPQDDQPDRVGVRRRSIAHRRGETDAAAGECPLPRLQIVRRLSFSWRALNGGPNLMATVVAGEVYQDGVIQGSDSELEVMTA